MKHVLLLVTCLCSFLVLAQKKQKIQKNYNSIDAKMDKMPIGFSQSMDSISAYIKNNFESESDRIRAVFYWTANTISYDADNMFEVKFDESLHERISRAFVAQKGNCFDYASIFDQLAGKVGIKSMVVSGYTKWNKVRIDNLSHAWNAARIDNKWYLFDPTWGSGYVINGVFSRKIDNDNFKVTPEIMINSHMPFDYLWQFLNQPITNQEFMDGVYDGTKENYDFEKEIVRYENLPKVEQLLEISQRIEKGGMKNQHVAQAFVHAKTAWRNEDQNAKGNKYSEIINQFNQANQEFNDFLRYRNKQFQPMVSDEEIRKKIEEPRAKIVQCQEALSEFEKTANSAHKTSIDNFKTAMTKAFERTEQHLQFVNSYLAKPNLSRKAMFYKVLQKPKLVNNN